MSPRTDLQWSLAFTAIIQKALQELAGAEVQLYQKEDVLSLLSSNPLTCFERVVVCGTMDLSTPFLVDEEEARNFEKITNQYLRSSKMDQISSHPSIISPNDVVRVTILLRSNNRFIMNLVS